MQFDCRGVAHCDIRLGLRVTPHKGQTVIGYAADGSARRPLIQSDDSIIGTPARSPRRRRIAVVFWVTAGWRNCSRARQLLRDSFDDRSTARNGGIVEMLRKYSPLSWRSASNEAKFRVA